MKKKQYKKRINTLKLFFNNLLNDQVNRNYERIKLRMKKQHSKKINDLNINYSLIINILKIYQKKN